MWYDPLFIIIGTFGILAGVMSIMYSYSNNGTAFFFVHGLLGLGIGCFAVWHGFSELNKGE